MALAPDDYSPTTRERLSTFFRLSRRDPATSPVTLTSSGTVVDIGDSSAIQATIRNRQEWQRQVYDALDACGEISNGVMTLGNLLSRVAVFPAEYPSEPDGEPVRTSDSKVTSIVSTFGTAQELSVTLKQAGIQKLLPGEYQLIGIAPGMDRPNKDRWEWLVVSLDELKSEGDSATVEHPSGPKVRLEKGRDTWIRIWSPHPRKQSLAYSPLRPLLNNIDELVWWDAAGSATAKSRLGQRGMAMFPNNIEAPIKADDPPGLTGSQRVLRRWTEMVSRAIREPGSPSAAVPMAMTYPWNEQGKSGVEIIEFKFSTDELMQSRTDLNLHRIAQGFPLPPEFFFGTGEATYGGASQISRDKSIEYVEPFIVDLLADWTKYWMHPILRSNGIDPLKYLFWYDPSALYRSPRQEDQSNKGFEYGNINAKAWRRENNFSEADAPTEKEAEEQLAWIRALRGREGNPEAQEGDPDGGEGNLTPSPQELPEGKSHPPRRQPSAPARGKGQPVMASVVDNGHHVNNSSTNDLGKRLAEIDADLMSRLSVMASEQTHQALIKAGNFLRNRARKNPTLRASIRNTPPEDVAITLGREHVATLGTDGMLDGTFDDVPAKFSEWCDKAVGAAIEAASLPPVIVSSATFQFAYSTEDAAAQLVRDLKENASSLVFDRSNDRSLAPEQTDLLVPARIIRRALAMVGNPSPNGHVDLLLATGRTFTRHLADAGHFCTSHEWVYPIVPARHPFSTHRNLDGQRISVDDASMTAGDGSEHCLCLLAPVFE